MIGSVFVVGSAGNAVARVRFRPAPGPAVNGVASGWTGIGWVDGRQVRGHKSHAVELILGVCAQITRVTTRVLPEGDRIARAVGKLGDPSFALVQQTIDTTRFVAK